MKEQAIQDEAAKKEMVQIGFCMLSKKSIAILKEFIKELEINPDNDNPLKSTKFYDFVKNNNLDGSLHIGGNSNSWMFDNICFNGFFNGFYRDFFGNLLQVGDVIHYFEFLFCNGKPHRIDVSITIKVRQDFSFDFAEFLKIIELIKID